MQSSISYLHISILYSIVDHLHIVPSSILTHPITARLSIDLGSNRLEDVLNGWPGIGGSSRHQRRAIPCTILSPTHTTTNKENTFLPESLGTTLV